MKPLKQKACGKQMLRLPEVEVICGIKRSIIRLLELEGTFARRVKLGLCSVGWLESEVLEWQVSRLNAELTHG